MSLNPAHTFDLCIVKSPGFLDRQSSAFCVASVSGKGQVPGRTVCVNVLVVNVAVT